MSDSQTFRTECILPESEYKITRTAPILSLGSCFSENIGSRLNDYLFPIQVNPFGILYHPLSILNALQAINDNKRYTASDLVEHDGKFHSFDHHGSFSSSDGSRIINTINHSISTTEKQKGKTAWVLLTLGTSHFFRHKASGKVVANCHKIPNSEFLRERLAQRDLEKCLTQIAELLETWNPELQILWTVSPVRHLRDGLVENNFSKAQLRTAIGELVETRNRNHYFPSYEILMDDLRDYRFYSNDMMHPSLEAKAYLFDKLAKTFLPAEARKSFHQLSKFKKAAEHRILDSTKKTAFFDQMRRKIQAFESQTGLDASKYLNRFS